MIDRDINICVCVHFMETKMSSCLCCSLECVFFSFTFFSLCYTCTFNKIKLKLEMNFGNFNALIFLRSCTKSLIT